MSLIGMHLGFNGDLNTGRQEQPIKFAGDSDRRSKSGPGLPPAHLLNAATGIVTMAHIMASEYNQGMVPLYMGDIFETLDIVKYPYDASRMILWVLLKCVKLLFSEIQKMIENVLFSEHNKKLVFQGEKWMKDCVVVIMLIAIVATEVDERLYGGCCTNSYS